MYDQSVDTNSELPQRHGRTRFFFAKVALLFVLAGLLVVSTNEYLVKHFDPNGYASLVTRSATLSPPTTPVSAAAKEQARNFVFSRRDDYFNRNLEYQWKLRGVGYLYTSHNMILLAVLPTEPLVGMRHNITIYNIANENNTTECDKLTIWVRVNGPEIFAGAAVAILSPDGYCFWTFNFDLQLAGDYEVDVKLLLWNGNAPVFEDQCSTYQTGQLSNTVLTSFKHDGFQGFKMYSAPQMCCEICTRIPHCESWASPFLRMIDPSFLNNGCELFFQPSAPDEYVPVSNLWPRQRHLSVDSYISGQAHSNPTSYFMGCGWSFHFTLDFQCVSGNLDDRVFSVESYFTARSDEANGVAPTLFNHSSFSALPLCTLKHENFGEISRGRWIREAWSTSCPPFETIKAENKNFDIAKFYADDPQCWHRDDLSIIGKTCMEPNCRKINSTAIWYSSVHLEQHFCGYWQPYSCRYQEFTTQELQECVTRRKIGSFKGSGASVAQFLEAHLDHRLTNISFHSDHPEALTVVYDTLSLLHLLKLDDKEIVKQLSVLPQPPEHHEHYWISGFFLSSEREVHTQVARGDMINRLLIDILPKSYRLINAYDLTAAFTYDTATQNDGMHLIGPPMKTIVNKLLHHVCRDQK